jgi:hypothetical protein
MSIPQGVGPITGAMDAPGGDHPAGPIVTPAPGGPIHDTAGHVPATRFLDVHEQYARGAIIFPSTASIRTLLNLKPPTRECLDELARVKLDLTHPVWGTPPADADVAKHLANNWRMLSSRLARDALRAHLDWMHDEGQVLAHDDCTELRRLIRLMVIQNPTALIGEDGWLLTAAERGVILRLQLHPILQLPGGPAGLDKQGDALLPHWDATCSALLRGWGGRIPEPVQERTVERMVSVLRRLDDRAQASRMLEQLLFSVNEKGSHACRVWVAEAVLELLREKRVVEPHASWVLQRALLAIPLPRHLASYKMTSYTGLNYRGSVVRATCSWPRSTTLTSRWDRRPPCAAAITCCTPYRRCCLLTRNWFASRRTRSHRRIWMPDCKTWRCSSYKWKAWLCSAWKATWTASSWA